MECTLKPRIQKKKKKFALREYPLAPLNWFYPFFLKSVFKSLKNGVILPYFVYTENDFNNDFKNVDNRNIFGDLNFNVVHYNRS